MKNETLKKKRRKSHNFLKALTMLSLTALIVTLTAYAARLTAEVGQAEPQEQSISVDGEATISVVPDLAIISISLETKDQETARAQDKHSAQGSSLINQIKGLGILEEDIQTTSYNIHEEERYNPDTRTYDSIGWVVNESWEIKVKDLDKVSDVLLRAGHNGATNVSGPRFQVDDTDAAIQEARTTAIADAEKNAKAIADALGLRLDKVIDYTEWSGGDNPPFYAYAETTMDARGGTPTPNIEPGQEELTMNVSITYRLR